MPYLTTEKRATIFTDFGGKAANTGSIEGQVALLTERINQISEHLKINRKDFVSGWSQRSFSPNGMSILPP